MATLAKLERHEGHLLNWYDIQTLAPLEPRYVSMVDSGNLLAALSSLGTGLTELLHRPVLDGKVFDGLVDTIAILEQTYREEIRSGKHLRAIRRLSQAIEKPPENPTDALRLLRHTAKDPASLATAFR